MRKNLPVNRWIRKLRTAGRDYAYRILVKCTDEAEALRNEIAEIERLHPDLNCTNGGETFTFTPETIARMTEGQRRRRERENLEFGQGTGVERPPKTRYVPIGGGELTCASCGRDDLTRADFHSDGAGVASRCKRCRSVSYFARRYPQPCAECAHHVRLDRNGRCGGCNGKKGLRECRKCEKLLVTELSFHGVRRTCTECRKLTRR